jgi:membrane fusion protein (multidrug efflux system)
MDFSDVVVDPQTGAVSLRAQLPNPDKYLLPGSFVTLKATLGEQNNVFLVPQAAVQRDTIGAYAMVVGKDGKVARKNVETSGAREGNWLVTSGLAAGDQVIAAGLQKVKEGAAAKATPWNPNAAPAGAPNASAPNAATPAAGAKPAANGETPAKQGEKPAAHQN